MARNGYNKISPSEDKESVSFVSLLFFQWMNGIFKTGSERPLDENDFLPLSKENSASFLTDQLQANWNKEKTKCDRNQKRPKLWKSVIVDLGKGCHDYCIHKCFVCNVSLSSTIVIGIFYFHTDVSRTKER